MLTDDQQIELKRITVGLVASMLDNHDADWDDKAVARAFETIYAAVRGS